ncbi:MAG: hypothetical protein WA733_03895 [Methylocystis sp.]
MSSLIRVTKTQPKTFSSARQHGFGFEIEKRGSGPSAEDWSSILELVYGTEEEAEKAERAIEEAIGNPVDAQGWFSGA